MKKKFFFYSQPYLDRTDLNCLKSVFKSNFLTQGPKINEFEKKISNYVNSKYSTTFNSATSALHAACFSLGFKKNDVLWTVPNTFVASANCSRYLGGNVDFVDIDKETKNINIDLLSKKLNNCKKKNLPKIIVPVDFGGNPVLQDKIYNLSKKYNFKIVEDASHALGAKYKNYMVGSCKWSDITIFSFHPVKTITTGEGGVATTNNSMLDRKLKMFRTHGITKDKSLFENKLNKNKDWYYEQQFLGFNYRMTDIAAALGINQLKKINFIIKKRNKIAQVYKKNLYNLPLKLPNVTSNSLSTFHLFTIQIIKKNSNMLQLKLYKFLKKNGIITNVHYLPVHLHPYYRRLGFKKNTFPISEMHAESSLSLPIYPNLLIKEARNIAKLIRYFFKNN
jgi:UDP-4-amino-4,6-dideoxy-N-acetyl-beta-L-altrosamine transaminase